MGRNTEIALRYRTVSNDKTLDTVIVSGAITSDMIEVMQSNMYHGFQAICHQIGLPSPVEKVASIRQLESWEDHPWTEFVDFVRRTPEPSDLLTDKAPTIDLTIAELVSRFRALRGWDARSEKDRLGIVSARDLEQSGYSPS